MLPRTHTNCTNEIPAILSGINVFIDPISFVIKAAAAPVRCNDVAPQRWRLNGQWYCAFPEFRDCAEPERIPMKPMRSWRSLRTSRRASGRVACSWLRAWREPTIAGLEESGAQVFPTWPLRA